MTDDALRDPHLPVLIVTGSKRDGASLVLETQGYEKILGTSGDCHLRVEGGNVDFHHARVLWDERGVVLSDEGSSTGTYVNGERIGSEHPLEDGDRICLGPPGSRNSVKLLVRVPHEIAEAQTVGFSAGMLDLSAVHDAPIVLDPEPKIPEPPRRPAPAPAVTMPEPPPAADEPILLEPPTDGPWAPAPDEVFFIDDAPPVPTRKLPTAPDEPMTPTVRLPPRPEPEPIPMALVEPPPPPRVEPPPPPSPKTVAVAPLPAVRAEPPSVPAPPALPSISERPRPRPDYAPELPSIAMDQPAIIMDEEEEGAPPPAEAPFKRLRKKREAAPPKAPSGPPSKVIVFGGGAVVLAALIAGGVWMMGGRSGVSTPPGAQAPAEDAGPPGALRITSLEPEVALPGNTVELVGTNLPADGLKLTVAGVPATIDQNANGRLRFRVPKLPVVVEGQSVPVVLAAGANSSKAFDLFLGRLPLVSQAQPREGVPGDVVTVKGRGFDVTLGGNQVSFGDDPALVLAATATELKVVVPAPRSALNRVDAPVIVRRGGSSSSDTVVFNITRPSEGVYKLKFFGTAVEGDAAGEHAFVSTEVGPLLLLTGRGTSASVGERATAIAAALNGLIGQSPRFEVRAFAVAVIGRPDPIITVTPIDAGGYTKPLDPAMSTTFPSLPVVASYWTALLQDAFELLGKAERPTRVLELSPRGKVLMDLYSEAERQLGRGNGIPTRLVSPPTWTVAKAFREMALVLPTRGGAVAAAAVAGRWQGEMEEPGSPRRPLSLELRLDGTKLTGTMTTNAGGINLNAPLRDVTYANGILSFTLLGGTAPRRVQGKVNGAQLEGTIQAAAGAPAGRVRLRYLE